MCTSSRLCNGMPLTLSTAVHRSLLPHVLEGLVLRKVLVLRMLVLLLLLRVVLRIERVRVPRESRRLRDLRC